MNPAFSVGAKLALPTVNDPAQLKGLVVNALDLLGEELGLHIDSELTPILGKEWLADLAYDRKVKGFYSLTDPGFILREILFYSTSPMRRALPGGDRFYRRLEQAQNYRNLYFHNEGRKDLNSIAAVVQLLTQIASEIPLPTCISEFGAVAHRLDGLKRGESFDISQAHLDQIAELERKLAQFEEDILFERQNVRKREEEVETAQAELSKKEDELIRLRRLDDTRSAAYGKAEADRAAAEEYVARMSSQYFQQLAVVEKQSQLEKRLQQLLQSAIASTKSIGNIGSIDIEKIAKNTSKKTAEKTAKKTAEKTAKKTAEKTAKKTAKKPAEKSAEANQSLKIKKTIKKKSLKKVPGKSGVAREAVEPGLSWPSPKGTRRFTLSANFKTVYDTKTGEMSESLKPVARSLAKEWLAIKPQGGRVFMDPQGNATCYIGEELIYLGNGAELLR
jgi:hypothetical protein